MLDVLGGPSGTALPSEAIVLPSEAIVLPSEAIVLPSQAAFERRMEAEEEEDTGIGRMI